MITGGGGGGGGGTDAFVWASIAPGNSKQLINKLMLTDFITVLFTMILHREHSIK
jgi:hypothetical protein